MLIVDDDPDIRELMAGGLDQMGFEVHTKSDGEAGLTAARDVVPDVVVLDWSMPKLSGLEVCAQIRANSDLKRVGVIVISGNGGPADSQEVFAAGADDYMVKPFCLRELVTRVESLLARRGTSTSADARDRALFALSTQRR
ncbi:MAG: hypothetical protein JWL83_589 [Actinomycetia bacterium]|nr:hypothetical protein [Actinomycetes bacterium]